MILKSATVRCFGVNANGEKISWEKTFKGYAVETLMKKARKCFDGFLLFNDISDSYYFTHRFEFGVYITEGIAYGCDPLNISIYAIRDDI